MRATVAMPEGLRHARRTAATARAALAAAGAVLILAHAASAGRLALTPALMLVGLAIIFVTAQIQLLIPSIDWLKIEESLAPVAAVLIVGFGAERVTAVWLLWLAAVACGVLARGGRQFWVGRALLLVSLALPIVREQRLTLGYACQCLAAIALLLVCGRVTRELRAMLDRARWDADHDGLTGALSRAAFRARLDGMAQEAPGDGALVLVDLDNFGSVNKSAGHAAGDAILRSVVHRMRSVLGDEALVGRLGGDEFAAILHGSDAKHIGERLLAAVEDTATLAASAGMAIMPRDGRDADSLLRAVDVALRVAKRSGSHHLSVYAGDPIFHSGTGGALDALNRLIGGEGLEIVVQPIVALADGTAHAFEALARFRPGASSSPLHWFALADELASRDRLELACLRTALRLLDDLPGDALLSVNLSGPLLLDPRTDDLLAGVSDPRRLILELTENSLVDDSSAFVEVIARHRDQGMKFAVDDMGAGYSGLRQITTLHPSYLKLDRSLVSGIDSDPDRAALLGAMLGYVRQVGGHLVAEGVETEAELRTLRGLGVQLVQGFLLGRPAPPWPRPAAIGRGDLALTRGRG